ncbi:ATP-binding protein [Streptomyces sp. NPDC020917]|uniref:ATP-binding protein n=1 Tax=Streptomyces sp. NPDC020917 TaxID=3365102 RepID=UPI003795A0EA
MDQAPSLPVTLWPATPHSVHRARHALLDALDAWELGGLGDSAALVLSELMTNAVRHGRVPGRGIGTRFVRQGNGLRIEVHDCGDAKPELQSPADDSEHGRGLALVEAITGSRWGVVARSGPGKVVWAELAAE